MSKALVIKGADFSANAVEQIVIEENVPCTGLELSISGQSVEFVGDTLTTTAAKTPADTTDVITYSSSNEKIATVDSNGVVTVIGIGEATITATCGAITASVTVNQQNSIKVGNLVNIADYFPDGTGGQNTAGRVAALSGQRAIGQAYDGTSNVKVYNGETAGVQVIPIPYGARYVFLHGAIESADAASGRQVCFDIEHMSVYSGNEYATYLSQGSSMNQLYKREIVNYDATGIMLRHPGSSEINAFDYITFSVS